MVPNIGFGETDPRHVPKYFFFGAVQLDYASAVRANVGLQNYSTCPRHWYIDADFLCWDCRMPFTWTADEQRAWFEEYRFYVDSHPTRCPECRKARRYVKTLKQEYDRTVAHARGGGTLAEKKQVLILIDQIEAASKGGSPGLEKTRALLLAQVKAAERRAAAGGEDCA